MLVVGSLGRHSVVVGLTVHALSEAAVALLLAVTSELVHIVSIVRATVVWVVVRVTTVLALGLLTKSLVVLLALLSRSRRKLTA